jgi:hypothetical protein
MSHPLAALILALSLAAPAAAPEKGQKAEHDPRDDGPDKIDVSSYPAEQQERYDIFRAKCSKCHPVARPINSRYDVSDWKRYMKKMIRRPNSGINEEQAVEIFEFLKYYSGRQAAGK